MDKEAKEKIQTLVKSMYKSVKQINKKTAAKAVKDVLDPDKVAEMPADSVSSGSTGVMDKSKKDCGCKSCECNKNIKKTEDLTKNIVDNFKKITEIYLKKQEKLAKGRMITPEEKRQLGYDKKSVAWRNRQEQIKNTKLDTEHPQHGDEKTRIKNIPHQKPEKMAASENRCWEGYEPTPGKKPYSEGSCKKTKK